VARNPIAAFTLQARAYIHVWHGHAAEALQIGERLLRLDPLDQYHHADLLAYANYLVGNYERSLMFFRRVGQMNWLPDHAYLAACLGQLGRVEEAQATWRRGLELMPGFSVEKFMEIMAFRDLGYRKHWVDGLHKAGLME
jgi:adenylate cyclase